MTCLFQIDQAYQLVRGVGRIDLTLSQDTSELILRHRTLRPATPVSSRRFVLLLISLPPSPPFADPQPKVEPFTKCGTGS